MDKIFPNAYVLVKVKLEAVAGKSSGLCALFSPYLLRSPYFEEENINRAIKRRESQ